MTKGVLEIIADNLPGDDTPSDAAAHHLTNRTTRNRTPQR